MIDLPIAGRISPSVSNGSRGTSKRIGKEVASAAVEMVSHLTLELQYLLNSFFFKVKDFLTLSYDYIVTKKNNN